MSPSASERQHPLFRQALTALDAGDLVALGQLLRRDPTLAQAREQSAEAPYDGYFHRATLLHHLAGNPIRQSMPANVVDLAALLLAAGAEVDAPCGGGPSQPESGGGTTLGLVASGAQAHKEGHTEALIDCLLNAGAALNPEGRGGLLWIALYHVVEHQGQREVARLLVDRGHPLDLCYTAGLGMVEEMQTFLDDGLPAEGADRFYRYHRRGPKAEPADLLQDAFLFASICAQPEAASQLLAMGADPQKARPWGGETPTPLQGAAWAGWPEMVEWLLDQGCDPLARDPKYNSNALGWAFHCKRHAVVHLLLADPANIDTLDALELGRLELFEERLGKGDPDQAIGIAPRGVLLRSAAHLGQSAAVKLLLERGADPRLCSPSGDSPLDLAKAGGHSDCVALIRDSLNA